MSFKVQPPCAPASPKIVDSDQFFTPFISSVNYVISPRIIIIIIIIIITILTIMTMACL